MSKYSDLYEDYKQHILGLMGQGDFYEELIDSIERGSNKISFFNRYLEKKIDLAWVDAIEACIIPLDNIVRNPRKFIVQEEEIVPIERARKITAESVRHLAQHTNLIARVDDDNVTPSSILNVFREESYEIYENRFIFTLIRQLMHFIDTRYNVLFKIKDDENLSSLKMESDISRGEEKIKYKLEISSQSTSLAVGDDADKNFNAFDRIGYIKQVIGEFAASAFMSELQHSTPVRPPIMRTNVIMKDPNFRACLNLWQFINSYNEVGYEIVAHESDEMVSEEYKNDLYRMIGLNYVLLKNNTPQAEEIVERKRRTRKLKPKMLKRLAEELVMDYDMEEVEIRRIFVDELKRAGKKKIKGEERINKAIDNALAREKTRKDAILEKIRKEEARRREMERRRKERERARIAREKQKEREKRERERRRQMEARKKQREKELKARRAMEALIDSALAREKAHKAALLEKERQEAKRRRELEARKRRQEKERLAKQRERERIAKQKAKEREKERLAKQRERERIAKQKAKEREKERIAREKEKERQRKAREREKQREREKAARAKERERQRLAREREKQREKERIAREKEKERQRIAREKEREREREKAAKAKEREKQRLAREKEKQREKERIAREKEKERQRLALERERERQRQKAIRERQREKERLTREKERQLERERLARERQKERERIAAQKAKEAQAAKEARERQRQEERRQRQLAKAREKERFAKERQELAARQLQEEQLLEERIRREKEELLRKQELEAARLKQAEEEALKLYEENNDQANQEDQG